MPLTKDQITECVIQRLDQDLVSKNHWAEVAQEMLIKNCHQTDLAITELAIALESFHHQYKSAVVKSNNLLDDLLIKCLSMVDWKKVSKSRYSLS